MPGVLFDLLPPKFSACPHCGGMMYRDEMDKVWICLNCARRLYDKEQHDITNGPEWTEPGEHTPDGV